MTGSPNDCFAPTSGLMVHADAIALLRTRLSASVGIESVPLEHAAGRILAQPVAAPFPVPGHTNAAVDGYAFAHTGYNPDGGARMRVSARAAAGHPAADALEDGHAARILTGAVMPAGTDTVAMQEDCTLCDGIAGEPSFVELPAGLKTGANVRRAGEDVADGQVVAEAGDLLRPQDLAALASVGCGAVTCFRRLKVAVVSSGDEVVRAGRADLALGQVFDANAPMLSALVALSGAEVEDLGIWEDNRETVQKRLSDAASRYDVILTSGGASQGEEDHMSAALAALGSRHFWRIAVKPGRPMMFGQIDDAMMVGLPGNPVAVFVCYLIYVYPMLRRLAGGGWPEPVRYPVAADFTFANRKLGRREYWRGTLIGDGVGEPLRVRKFARDGSGLISGLRAANGLIEIPEDAPGVVPGDIVSFIPFSEFGILGSGPG